MLIFLPFFKTVYLLPPSQMFSLGFTFEHDLFLLYHFFFHFFLFSLLYTISDMLDFFPQFRADFFPAYQLLRIEQNKYPCTIIILSHRTWKICKMLNCLRSIIKKKIDRIRNHVYRKKPPGKLLPGAHAVEREFQVILQIKQNRQKK